jgi:large subunit ribosomal protein L15
MDLKTVHMGVLRRKRKKRVGRGPGSKTGRTATRGNKGQYARKGDNPKLLKEGGQMPLFRRTAKRGFNNARFKPVIAPVNVGDLGIFKDGVAVNPEVLEAAGLAKQKHEFVKILGNGEIAKKLEVHAHFFSATAKEKIEKAGGKCVEIATPHVGPKVKNKMRPRKPKVNLG